MCNCSTIVTLKKALFGEISLLGDLAIAYRTNLVVIVANAFRTFHDQCFLHIRVLTMFTRTFRVTGGGRFKATTFCFLPVVFSVVVALLDAFSFTAILRSQFLLLLIFKSDEVSSLLLSFSEIFSAFRWPFFLFYLIA